LPKKGIKDWARVYEKTSLGPTTKICTSASTSTDHYEGIQTTYLWCETLEERSNALLLDHLLDDSHTSDLRVEVGILDTCLDNI